jgi:putative ABC transport system permease protein
MRFIDTIKLALRALLRNKTRTLLTMLGIIIGISSVIIMKSLGSSLTSYMQTGFSSIGGNVIAVRPEWNRDGGMWSIMHPLEQNDYEAIKSQCRHLAAVTPSVTTGAALVYGNNSHSAMMEGESTDVLITSNLKMSKGTMFDDDDIASSAKVCVVGATIVEKLFTQGENPIGQTIRCNDIPMLVIGVLAPLDQFMGIDMNDRILAPYTTVMKRFVGTNEIDEIDCVSRSLDDNEFAVAEIDRVLRMAHGLGPDDDPDFEIQLSEDVMKQLNDILGIVVLVLSLIAGISLVVGGVGIMNIMYVTVTERTREIGLRKAIGARKHSIMLQFLVESVVLSLVGGLIGILAGLGLYALATAIIPEMPFVLNVNAPIVSFGVCTLIGVFFGWYPSRRAANLDPIQAIRYE